MTFFSVNLGGSAYSGNPPPNVPQEAHKTGNIAQQLSLTTNQKTINEQVN